jgi:outer membrane protein OmpA-like peptidoglycan-associated protein
VESGFVDLSEGKRGLLLGGHLGLGTLFAPWMDFGAGARWWSADIDRSGLADTASGSVSNLSVHTDLRIPTFTWKSIQPYLVGGPAAQFVSADIPDDKSLEDAIAGFRFGFDAGVGLATTGDGARFKLEGRREFVDDVGNWNLALGVGIWPNIRAKRNETVSIVSPNVSVVTPPAQTYSAPPAAQPAPAPTPTTSPSLEPLVRELIEDNRALRAGLDSLRRNPPAASTSPTPPPAPPAPAPVAPTPAPTPPRPDLRATLERAAALSSGARVLPALDGWRYVLGDALSFSSGSTGLSEAAHDELRRLVAALLRFPDAAIVVEGHTDSRGSASKNLTLSEERSAAVRAELVLLGIDPARITSRGFGSTRPLTDNTTAEARARNRRVEIRVLGDVSVPSSPGR